MKMHLTDHEFQCVVTKVALYCSQSITFQINAISHNLSKIIGLIWEQILLHVTVMWKYRMEHNSVHKKHAACSSSKLL